MAETNLLTPHLPEFEPFLYAPVGEDRNGSVVTVLSTLARLGLDPWAETADLVMLGRDAARSRLETRLARFWDVPAITRDRGSIAGELIQLLPESPPLQSLKRAATAASDGRPSTGVAVWAVLAIALLLLQMLIGGLGAGK
jgi:hypothetical protein